MEAVDRKHFLLIVCIYIVKMQINIIMSKNEFCCDEKQLKFSVNEKNFLSYNSILINKFQQYYKWYYINYTS